MGKKGKKKKKKKTMNSTTTNPSALLPGNYVPSSCPGCHVVHDPVIPSWCLEASSERFDPEEFGLNESNEHLMPEISIEPDTGIVCLTNQSHDQTRSFFITFGHQLVGRSDIPLEIGVWRDESGGEHPCTTLVVVLRPRRLLEVCRVVPTRLDVDVSVWDATVAKRHESGGEVLFLILDDSYF
jgi:hypothetical protein